eukprot:3933336-Rhodomonas_salina.1
MTTAAAPPPATVSNVAVGAGSAAAPPPDPDSTYKAPPSLQCRQHANSRQPLCWTRNSASRCLSRARGEGSRPEAVSAMMKATHKKVDKGTIAILPRHARRSRRVTRTEVTRMPGHVHAWSRALSWRAREHRPARAEAELARATYQPNRKSSNLWSM